jgi:hypothetical protein
MPPIVTFPGGPTISQREFSMASRIKVGAKSMTATVVNLRKGRFLFTARHGIKNYPQDPIELFWDGSWHRVDVEPVENPDLDYDVVAARISGALTDRPYDEMLGAVDLFASQEVYFRGFPLGLSGDSPVGFPIPLALVKRGIVSAFSGEGGKRILFIDAMNTKGFSGGPVFASNPRAPGVALAAIIAKYRHRKVTFPMEINGTIHTVTIKENVGITIAYPLAGVIESINRKYG